MRLSPNLGKGADGIQAATELELCTPPLLLPRIVRIVRRFIVGVMRADFNGVTSEPSDNPRGSIR